jgi:hypothetical protein
VLHHPLGLTGDPTLLLLLLLLALWDHPLEASVTAGNAGKLLLLLLLAMQLHCRLTAADPLRHMEMQQQRWGRWGLAVQLALAQGSTAVEEGLAGRCGAAVLSPGAGSLAVMCGHTLMKCLVCLAAAVDVTSLITLLLPLVLVMATILAAMQQQ